MALKNALVCPMVLCYEAAPKKRWSKYGKESETTRMDQR
jgi:hypothetical protein